MKKIIAVFFFFLSSFFIANGQTDTLPLVIKGTLLQSNTNDTIKNATIIAFIDSTQKFALSNKDGSFSFSVRKIPDSLVITEIGYEKRVIKQFKLNNHFILLGNIEMINAINSLTPVVVVAQKKAVTFSLNKITYSVQSDTDNNGLTGIDVIQKVPLIDVGPNNKIFVNGKNTFIVLLNGRNSGIVGTDPSTFLKSIQSDLISKIEINTNPPAKYKLDGYEYVINIILLKKLIDGVFGSANGSVDTYGGYDLGYLLMAKAGKVRITNNSSFSHLQGPASEFLYENNNKFTKYSNSQVGSLKNRSNTEVSSLDLSYEIDTVKLFSLSCYYTNTAISSISSLDNLYKKNGMQYNQLHRNINNNDKSGFFYLSADYEVLLNEKRNSLTFSGKWYNNYFANKTDYIDRSVTFNKPDTGYNKNKGAGNEYTFQIDYAKYINSKNNLDFGAKEIIRKYNTSGNSITSLTANNNYTQNIHSLYFAYTSFTDKNSLTIGNGVNLTTIKYNDLLDNKKYNKTYFNSLPFVNYAHQLKNEKSISFDYILSVKRPSLSYINSGINYSNPENLQTGNPDLVPEIFNDLKFTYNTSLFKKPLIVGIYFKNSANSIVENLYPFQDSLLLRSFTNGGRFLSFGTTLYYYRKLLKKQTLSIRATADFGFLNLENKTLNLKNDGLTYKLFISVAYKLPHKFTISTQNFIYSRSFTIQGYSQNFSDMRISLTKKLINDKLNIGLTLYQPFRKRVKLESNYSDLAFGNFSYTDFPSRYLGISLSYDFGNIAKVFGGRQKRKRNQK